MMLTADSGERILYDILHQCVDDVEGFREMMRDTRSVISGQPLLQALDTYREWDLAPCELYVPRSKFFGVLKSMVVDFDAIAIDTPMWTNPAMEMGVGGIQGRARFHTVAGTIDIFRSRTETALLPIAHFRTTLTMNFVSADAIGVGYPSFTFSGRGLISPDPSTTDDDVAPYRRRGYILAQSSAEWTTENIESRSTPCGEHCRNRTRFFGDTLSKVVCFIGRDNSFDAVLPHPPVSLPFGLVVQWRLGADTGECESHSPSHRSVQLAVSIARR